MVQTVKQFIRDCYDLVSPSNPNVPLQPGDTAKGIDIMNDLLSSYSSSSLLLTIAKEVSTTLSIGEQEITFAAPGFTPTPTIASGRLSNLQNAWLILDGMTYPLIDASRSTFFDSYKYDPQQGLPRYVIVRNNVDYTTMRIYPSPSQSFVIHIFGKFELQILDENDDMRLLPSYYRRFLKLAVAKDIAAYKSRLDAWDEKLEGMLQKAEMNMASATDMNLEINSDDESYLNGSWRVRAGV